MLQGAKVPSDIDSWFLPQSSPDRSLNAYLSLQNPSLSPILLDPHSPAPWRTHSPMKSRKSTPTASPNPATRSLSLHQAGNDAKLPPRQPPHRAVLRSTFISSAVPAIAAAATATARSGSEDLAAVDRGEAAAGAGGSPSLQATQLHMSPWRSGAPRAALQPTGSGSQRWESS